MKTLFILSLSLLSPFYLFSQSRESRTNLTFTKASEKLTKAIGWELNKSTGKWVENTNVIDDSPCKSWWVSHQNQNFKTIEFKSVQNGNDIYYVLLVEKLSGSYKYPNIQEDWQEHKETIFFILNESDFISLKTTINKNEGKDTYFRTKFHGYINDRFSVLGGEHLYNTENLLAKITKILDKGYFIENCFMVNSQVVDGREVVRFRIPESCPYNLDSKKDEYFEVESTQFKKILELR